MSFNKTTARANPFQPIGTEAIPVINLRLPEAAKALGLCETHVRAMAARGELPGFQLPGQRVWLFPVDGLKRWSEEQASRCAQEGEQGNE